MTHTAAELRKIIKIAQKEGLKSLKLGDIHFEFQDKPAPQPATPTATLSAAISALDSEEVKMPGDDVMLYASTPYFDDLTEQREAAKGPPPMREK